MSNKDHCPEEVLKGIEEFNSSQFYQCHETLEEVWMKQKGPQREFIQGIIQLSVGYYHYTRNNSLGALKLLRRGLERIRQYEPRYFEIDVSTLVKAVEDNVDQLCDPGIGEDKVLKLPRIELIKY
jgi:predicted metal-dependent hydrolase